MLSKPKPRLRAAKSPKPVDPNIDQHTLKQDVLVHTLLHALQLWKTDFHLRILSVVGNA